MVVEEVEEEEEKAKEEENSTPGCTVAPYSSDATSPLRKNS